MRDEKDLKLALRWGKGGSKYQLLEQIFFIHPRQNFCLKEFTKTGKLYFEKSMTTTLCLVHTHCLTTAIMAATAASNCHLSSVCGQEFLLDNPFSSEGLDVSNLDRHISAAPKALLMCDESERGNMALTMPAFT